MHHINRGSSLSVLAAMALLLTQACADNSEAIADNGGVYVVSTGLLSVDTAAAAERGLTIFARDGQQQSGVVPLAAGLLLKGSNEQYLTIGESPNALIIFDANRDGEINADDPLWDAMHLAVDYNNDGSIGAGEYALIGECGVAALQFDTGENKVWSLHTDGEIKAVKVP